MDLTSATVNMLMGALWICAPLLAVTLLVSWFMGVVQAVSQVQEPALSFVPKVVAVALTLFALGEWMANRLIHHTVEMWYAMPTWIR